MFAFFLQPIKAKLGLRQPLHSLCGGSSCSCLLVLQAVIASYLPGAQKERLPIMPRVSVLLTLLARALDLLLLSHTIMKWFQCLFCVA